MKRIVLAALLMSSVAAADILANDNGKKITVDCAKDPNVTVNGNQNKLALKGTCASLSVSGNQNTVAAETVTRVSVDGNQNTVAVDATDAITSMGSHNKISWKKPATLKDRPAIRNPGDHNTISQAK
ncbi:MAG TPA: DUF3060 domain-containing protein [Kofleriaceae bacterium]|nr:DUF3060 domain-containing protein [Kofleriaceae bacterium]